MKELALIGPTASGKSDLALRLALEHNAYILSLDSLSLYKEIDIAAAKPSKEELTQVRHFGIDLIRPDEAFSVGTFAKLYQSLRQQCLDEDKNLIIVGGSSFYLRTLLQGLSVIPEYSLKTQERVKELLNDLPSAYRLLQQADPVYMANIDKNDRYRIEKMLLIYIETGESPSTYFAKNTPEPVIRELPIYEIDAERSYLKERIALRTQKMIKMGLVDEVTDLEYKYTRQPNSMKAIGIIEVFDYLDGRLTYTQMRDEIILHTAQLAKRQQTFNRTQFPSRRLLPTEAIYKEALELLKA